MFSAYPVMVFPFWFCSKSSLLLGLSLTVPLMVACLSIAIPIWIRNGYQFWVSRTDGACPEGNHRTSGMKEVCYFPVPLFLLLSVSGCLSLYRVMRCYFLLLFTTDNHCHCGHGNVVICMWCLSRLALGVRNLCVGALLPKGAPCES